MVEGVRGWRRSVLECRVLWAVETTEGLPERWAAAYGRQGPRMIFWEPCVGLSGGMLRVLWGVGWGRG